MRDIAGLQKLYGTNNKTKYSRDGDKKFEFGFTQVSDWDPGDYKIRLLPAHPDKAPKGWVRKDEHVLQSTLDNYGKVRISCAKNFGKPCTFCDFLMEVKKTKAFDEVDSSVQDALVDLEVKENYMLAITVFANERQEKYTGSNGKEYTKICLSPGTKELGKILTVSIDRSKTLHKALLATVSADPEVSQPDEAGSYLTLTKAKTYGIYYCEKNVPLERQDLLAKYPNLMKLQGKYVDESAMEAQLQSAWFYKHLVPAYLED